MATRISIIGTGAIGTSLGLALKASETTELHIVGHDRDREHALAALRKGAIDKYEWNLIGAVSEADLVILALPLTAIEETLGHIWPEVRSHCVITDTAPIKGPVVEWAARLGRDDVHFVGGHPLVQTDGFGPDAGRGDLFLKRRYALTPLPDTHGDAVSLVASVIGAMGAEPLFMEVVEHDGLATAVNQLPAAVAVALLMATTEHPGWREMSSMAGTLFEDATRLPSDQAPELRGLFFANREGLLRWLSAFQRELGALQQLLASENGQALEELLVRVLVARSRWAESQGGERPDPLMEEASQPPVRRSLFGLGGLGRKRDKKS